MMRRWLVPVVALLALFGPLMVTLVLPVSTAWSVALEQQGADATTVPLPIGVEPATGPVRTGGMPLSIADARALRDVDTLALLVITYGSQPELIRARVSANDGSCEFVAEGGTTLRPGGFLVLERRFCNPTMSTRDFMLWIRVGETGRVALAALRTTKDAADAIIVSAPDGSSHFAVRGEARRSATATSVRRLDLVAFMWHRDAPTITFWLCLFLAAGVGGVALIRSLSGARVALGAAMLTLGVAGTWAIVVPPLQGADEPDHLLSFAEVTGSTRIEAELEWLARRTHFERLRFRGDRQFRPADRVRPHDPPWTGDIHAERMGQRSIVAIWIWRAMGGLGTAGLPLPDALLAIRVLNAGILALVVGVSVALVWWAAGRGGGLWSLLGIAVIPSVPYFATMTSDWAFVASWSVLLAAAVVVLQYEGARAWSAGLGLTVATGLLLGTSVSAMAVVPLVGLLILSRAVLGVRDRSAAELLRFWGGVAAGVALTSIITRPLFTSGFARYDARQDSARMLELLNDITTAIAASPWLMLVPVLGLLVFEVALRHVPHIAAIRTGLTKAGRGLALILAAASVLVWIASLVMTLPQVQTLDRGTYDTVGDYVVAVLLAAATSGRAAGFDHLTFTSVVSGFGWIDAIVPWWLRTTLATAVVAALGFSVFTAYRERADRQLSWLVIGLAGVMITVGVIAAASFVMDRNVHGRYILTAAMIAVTLVCAGAGRTLAQSPPSARAVVIGLLAAIHGISLAAVTARYF